MNVRPRRSALYIPADKPRALEKARSLRCDIVIIDLEDSILPEAKEAARRTAVETVRAGGFGQTEVMVRVNGMDTPWGAEDLDSLRGAPCEAIVLPKVSSAAHLASYVKHIESSTPVWAMVETCAAFLHLEEIASMNTRLAGFIIGTNDLAKEMRCRLDGPRSALRPALTMAVMAARAHGLSILDGVYNDLSDDAGLNEQCEQGVTLGFDGKTLIHPRQIEAAHRAFSPSESEVRRARAIVAAFDDPANAGKGVLTVEGGMVEILHLQIARQVLAVAARINRKVDG